jgi:hypothetical protein
MKKLFFTIASLFCLSTAATAQVAIDQVVVYNNTSNDLYGAVSAINWLCNYRGSCDLGQPFPAGSPISFPATGSTPNTDLCLPVIPGTTNLGMIHGFYLRLQDQGGSHAYNWQTSLDGGICPSMFGPNYNTLGVSVSVSLVGTTLEIEIQ